MKINFLAHKYQVSIHPSIHPYEEELATKLKFKQLSGSNFTAYTNSSITSCWAGCASFPLCLSLPPQEFVLNPVKDTLNH